MDRSPPPARTPNERRAHRKTRTGCIECKRRRIKCDEQKPACKACLRYDVPCVYRKPPPKISNGKAIGPNGIADQASPSEQHQPLTTSTIQDDAATLSPSVTSATTAGAIDPRLSLQLPPAPDPHNDLEEDAPYILTAAAVDDLRLLHQWTTSTSLTLGFSDPVLRLWQTTLPAVGFEYPFVLHDLLSIAALHLAHLQQQQPGGSGGRNSDQRRALQQLATRHHSSAIRGFRACIQAMQPAAATAMFACGMTQVVHVLAMFGQLADSPELGMVVAGPDPAASSNSAAATAAAAAATAARRRHLLGEDFLAMTRGIETVLIPVFEHVRTGPLGSMLSAGNWHAMDPDLQAVPGDEKFRALAAAWSESCSSADVKSYDLALYALRKSHAFLEQFPRQEGERTGIAGGGGGAGADVVGMNCDGGVAEGGPAPTTTRSTRTSPISSSMAAPPPSSTALDPSIDDAGHGLSSGPLLWLHAADERFFRLLHQRQPPALLVWAYFAVLMCRVDHIWIWRGWARNIVSVVDEYLGDAWAEWMTWPKEVCGVV